MLPGHIEETPVIHVTSAGVIHVIACARNWKIIESVVYYDFRELCGYTKRRRDDSRSPERTDLG